MSAVQTSGGNGSGLDRSSSSSLAEVVDTILDKGLVIDAYVRVSLVGIEVVTIDARIVVAGVDTYLRFAEAVGRLNLEESGNSKGLPELVGDVAEGGAKRKVKGAAKGAIDAAGETVREFFDGDDDDDRDRDRGRERERGRAR
jgi:gas vesicle structural protein